MFADCLGLIFDAEIWQNLSAWATNSGKKLLCDGWCKYSFISRLQLLLTSHLDGKARKVHYACDLWFALNWGLITGFKSPFPWFYSVFFFGMIIHRARRDISKCEKVYGKAWEEYTRRVPYLFIPVSDSSFRVVAALLTSHTGRLLNQFLSTLHSLLGHFLFTSCILLYFLDSLGDDLDDCYTTQDKTKHQHNSLITNVMKQYQIMKTQAAHFHLITI